MASTPPPDPFTSTLKAPPPTAEDSAAILAVVTMLLEERAAETTEVDREKALPLVSALGKITDGGLVALGDLGETLMLMASDIAKPRVLAKVASWLQ